MVKIEITIPGPPKPLERHRTRIVKTKSGREFVSQYDPVDNMTKKAEISWLYKKATEGLSDMFIEGPVRLTVVCYIERPPSAPKKRIFPTVKPDHDNITKLICDALNKIAWRDDAQICEHHFYKRYLGEGETPYTKVYITSLSVSDLEVILLPDECLF